MRSTAGRGSSGVARNGYRSQLAQELGAETVLNPEEDDVVGEVLERTGGLGASKSVETSGQSRYMDILLRATRRLGDFAFVGESGGYTIEVSDGMIRNGLHLHGIWHWSLADAPDMLKMISEVGDSLDKLITHHFPPFTDRRCLETADERHVRKGHGASP